VSARPLGSVVAVGIVDEDVQRVRESASLVEIVQQFVALRRVGRRWVGLCPFHAEKTGSFNVNDELGFYKCFGCGASGDVITFVREVEHLDFVGAVEWLAAKGGINLRYTTGGEGRDRQRRTRLVEAVAAAVAWYHERLLSGADARAARDYLRTRGITGDTARRYQLGWAPDGWDDLVHALNLPADVMRDAGLAFTNRAGRLQDVFRARVLFPIFTEAGDAVAFGGRILPGSADPAKYKNSAESPVYTKSKVLYGLNWAKAEIVRQDRVVVCEGYTDVIGMATAGVPVAVATCGTALTAEHFRLLKRFANRVVLAFDADEAGQGAADRFYQWERDLDLQVSVARLPAGTDPGQLSLDDPAALRAAVDDAVPFLKHRLDRVLRRRPITTVEDRARTAEAALAVVAEHPDLNVRKLYALEVAGHCRVPEADAMRMVERQGARPVVEAIPATKAVLRDGAEVAVLALLVHQWERVAPGVVPELFADDTVLAAVRALDAADGDWARARESAEPAARELLERVAVAEPAADAEVEIRNLIAAAARREYERRLALGHMIHAVETGDRATVAELNAVRLQLEELSRPEHAVEAAEALLLWLDQGVEGEGKL
jgi:DNA primase